MPKLISIMYTLFLYWFYGIILLIGVNQESKAQSQISPSKILQQAEKLAKARKSEAAYREAKKAYEVSKQSKELELQQKSLFLLFDIAWTISNYPDAIEHGFNLLQLSENQRDTLTLIRASNMIGIVHNAQGNHKNAKVFFERALALSKQTNYVLGQALSANNLGEVYKDQKNYTEAQKFYFEALKINEQINDEFGRAIALNNIGEIYFKQKQYSQALEYFHKSIKIKKALKNAKSEAITLNNLAVTYQQIDDAKEALKYARGSLKKARLAHSQTDIKLAYLTLSQIYEKQERFDQALKFYQKYKHLEDSLLSGENSERINQIQIRYEKDKKQVEIELLQSKRERDNLLLLILFVSLVALGLISGLLYRQQRIKTLKNQEITSRNLELQETREELRQSNEELLSINSNLEGLVKEGTRSLRLSNAKLVRANRELDVFIYRASHDFKAPLASLMGLVELGKLTLPHTDAKDLLSRIEFTVVKADSMLNKLMMVNSINHKSSDNTRNYEEIQIESFITGCLNRLPTKIVDSHQFEVIIQVDDLPSFRSEPSLLGYIFDNLIENALFFAKQNAPSQLEISVEDKQDYILISFEDNGIGIDKESQTKVFEMFYRGSEQSRGNGLGLHVVMRALNKLRGRITLESELNKGSLFQLFLPYR